MSNGNKKHLRNELLMYALANVLIRTRKNTQLATREMGK
jgi:hypothetical protein